MWKKTRTITYRQERIKGYLSSLDIGKEQPELNAIILR